MEASDSEQVIQTESVKEVGQDSSPVKSTPVSVIQAPPSPAKTNGTEGEKSAELTNGDVQQPSEEVPEQLLQGEGVTTTVASLIEQTAPEDTSEISESVPESTEPEPEKAAAESTEPAPAPAVNTVASPTKPAKPTAADLSAEWEEEGDVEMTEVQTEAQTKVQTEEPKTDTNTTVTTTEENTAAQDEAVGAEDGSESPPRKSGRKVKPTEKVLEGAGDIEESIEAIANELANSAQKKVNKESLVDSSKKAGRPKKKDLDEKVDNVTKLGNNMYFYTGPGGQDSPPPLNSDDEGEGESKKAAAPAPEASRISKRAGKGRNPRLEREDEEVEIPKKLPAKPNLNPGWLKDAAKAIGGSPQVDKKSPVKKKVVATPSTPNQVKESSEVSTPELQQKEGSPPKDEELPQFDPNKFEKGYVPKTVKKGEDEYVVIVQGVQDTGLCGKYWGDTTNLPSRRRSKAPEAFKAGDSPESSNRVRRGSSGSTGSNSNTDTPLKTTPKKQDAPAQPKSNKKQVTKPETPKPAVTKTEAKTETATETPDNKNKAQNGETPAEKGKRGRKRKVETEGGGENAEADKKPKQESSPAKTPSNPSASSKSTNSTPTGTSSQAASNQRSFSCVSDTSTQKEVVVECFAPYDDHRWVNIGKERDGMQPDAVQYARALRPPYHLLSFLRIKGHSTKGMSCTDKNTMVFVVLEGEITVILHTTQFQAKKGDSFYIPPKNYYNLINQKAREAELSLIQFQYDGPLPTVSQPTASSTPPTATSSKSN